MNKRIEIDKEIENAMLQCENPKTAERLVDFLHSQNEKYTYDPERNRYFINSFYPSFPGPAWNRLISAIGKISNDDKRIPLAADIVVTGRCHCHCWHCFRAMHNPVDLSFEKIQECIQSLHHIGAATVGITGGEPMLRNDIFDIISSIPEDMEGQIYTTGIGIDEVFAKRLKNTSVTRCIISLDHYDKETVCRLRNQKNAYDDVVSAVRALTTHHIYTSVTVCMTKELAQEEEFEKYIAFANSLGVSEIRVVMQIPQGNLEGVNVGKLYAQTLSMVKKIKEKYNKRTDCATILNFCEVESSDYFGCNAGSNYISINNDGNITPCVAVPLTFGNVNEKSLEEIYQDMNRYFPCSSRVCYGIASGRIMQNDNIDTSRVPISRKASVMVAEKCVMATGKGELFRHCRVN